MAQVESGLERLIADDRVRGQRVGVLCHHASVTRDLVFAVDALRSAGAQVVRLFGPEHGPWGTAQYMVAVTERYDRWTGLELVSLYGNDEASLRPNPDAFSGLDLVVIDLQDVGARYYTYAQTAAFTVLAARDAGVRALVCDRPNPIGGRVEGNLLRGDLTSFVGMHPVPQRHGLTLGELVRLYTGGVAEVVPMRGWRRAMWFDDTDLPWVPPSPNMPTLTTAALYPGLCLLEGTNISEGRGTTTPFEVIGAPFIDPFRLAQRLAAFGLEGVGFRPHVFQPTFDKFVGVPCGGVQLVVRDRDRLQPVRLGVAVLIALRELSGDAFQWRQGEYEFVTDRLAVDLLLGQVDIRRRIEAGAPLDEVLAGFDADAATFRATRHQWLLYDADD